MRSLSTPLKPLRCQAHLLGGKLKMQIKLKINTLYKSLKEFIKDIVDLNNKKLGKSSVLLLLMSVCLNLK